MEHESFMERLIALEDKVERLEEAMEERFDEIAKEMKDGEEREQTIPAEIPDSG